ncbi:MAG: LiaF domain-containing protein [Gemmatimonadaceae bacterium]
MTTPSQPPLDPRFASAPLAPVATQMIVPDDLVPAVRGVTAFLSTQVRAGDWILPRLFRAVAFWGNVTIDLTSARFGAGRSRLELVVIMGNVTVLVPPDVRVECDGDAIIGSFDLQGQKWSTPMDGSPTIHVTGTAYIGSVEVKVVNPNAPSWLEMLRTRWNQARGLGAGEP